MGLASLIGRPVTAEIEGKSLPQWLNDRDKAVARKVDPVDAAFAIVRQEQAMQNRVDAGGDMAEDFNQISQKLLQEVARLESERRALETKIHALQQTEEELEERIGDHMKNLEVKMRLEQLQAAARKWVAQLDEHGI